MSDEADVTDPLGPPRLVRAEVRARLLIGTLSHSLLRRSLVVLCVAILCFLPGLFALPVTDRDEARFAQASKQMLETRDFVDIRFQDEPRYKKPVGIYWLQSASAAVLGVDHIAAFRVPSMLGATAASMVTAQIGTVLFGPAAGLLSGVVLASTLLVVGEANIAKTDAVLLFSATLVGGLRV